MRKGKDIKEGKREKGKKHESTLGFELNKVEFQVCYLKVWRLCCVIQDNGKINLNINIDLKKERNKKQQPNNKVYKYTRMDLISDSEKQQWKLPRVIL